MRLSKDVVHLRDISASLYETLTSVGTTFDDVYDTLRTLHSLLTRSMREVEDYVEKYGNASIRLSHIWKDKAQLEKYVDTLRKELEMNRQSIVNAEDIEKTIQDVYTCYNTPMLIIARDSDTEAVWRFGPVDSSQRSTTNEDADE